MVWCNYLNTILSIMKKLSISILLSSILSSLSWAGYTVNVSSNTGGFIPSGGGTYEEGFAVTITAIPSSRRMDF